jgi:hypothetical protein
MMLDDYVVDILMRDLVGHDHQPTSFLIYLWFSYETARSRRERVPVSYQTIADSAGVGRLQDRRADQCALAGSEEVDRSEEELADRGTDIPRSASLARLTELASSIANGERFDTSDKRPSTYFFVPASQTCAGSSELIRRIKRMAMTYCEGVVARQKSHFRSEEPKDGRVRVNLGVQPPA